MKNTLKPIPWRRALVEIITIVLSILLALAVNEWRQSVSDRTMEVEYLQRIRQDVKENIEIAVNYQRQHERQVANARSVFDVVSSGDLSDLDPVTIVLNSYGASPSPTPSWVVDTFGEMNSTGRMSLISDVNLRAEMQSYFRYLESNGWSYQFMSTEYRDAIRKNMHHDLQLGIRSRDWETADFQRHKQKIDRYVAWLSNNQDVERGLTQVIVQWTRAKDEFLPNVIYRSSQLDSLITDWMVELE